MATHMQTNAFSLVALSLILSAVGQEPSKMTNIGRLFQGYDVMNGNPLSTTHLTDPGHRQLIFNATYETGRYTDDGRYLMPDFTDIQSIRGSCLLTFQSEQLSGTNSYQKSLQAKASVEGSGWGAKFSASSDFQLVQDESSSNKMVYTHSEVSCGAYEATILTYTPPKLHANFLKGLQQLPVNYDAGAYRQFIDAFGTHYIYYVEMGALFGQQSSFLASAYSKMISDDVDIDAAAGFSAWFVSASASVQSDDQKKIAQTFAREATKQRIYSRGNPPPSDNQPSTWMQSAVSEPAPMTLRLRSLVTLLDKTTYPELSSLPDSIKANLQEALNQYCSSLQAEGLVKSCDDPSPDPPLPTGQQHGIMKTKWDAKCMDYNLVSGDGNVYMNSECHGDANQQWYFSGTSLKTKWDDKCMDYNLVSGDGNVFMNDCNGGANQQWYFSGTSLKTKWDDKCMDYNLVSGDGNVFMNACNGGTNQQWYFAYTHYCPWSSWAHATLSSGRDHSQGNQSIHDKGLASVFTV